MLRFWLIRGKGNLLPSYPPQAENTPKYAAVDAIVIPTNIPMTKINNTAPPSKLLSLTVISPVPCCDCFLSTIFKSRLCFA